MKRKLTLEHRIARLEKLFNSTVKKSRKFEGLHPDMLRELQTVFDNHFASPSYYTSERYFQEEIEGMADGANDMMVDDAIQYLCDEFGYNVDRLESVRDDITDDLSQMAQVLLDNINDDEDWDDDDEMDECRGRQCESRKRRIESKRSLKRARNEDVKKLPNGTLANRVSDVLSAWADTSWSRPRDAIKELDRKGILKAAINKWYPTVSDVADAVEDCWDDQIGAVGAGTAQFFIGNIGGMTKCSLTLYPITGGESRARNLVLKFNWPDEMV